MPRGVRTTTNETPEQKVARIAARRDAEDRALRKSLLMTAEKAIKRSRAALDAGDMADHEKWFGIAVNTLGSYETVTGEESPNGATSDE
jgi:hypothetical protein